MHILPSPPLPAPPLPLQAADFKRVNHTEGLCLWYGQCKKTLLGWQNCYNNTPARSAEPGSEVYELLEELCPWYAKGSETKVCCDKNMLKTLKSSILPAQNFLQRCPSCFTNFMRLFCATTCDPNAATFMDLEESNWDPATNAISQVEVYMTYSFADILFNACKNVQSSQQGEVWGGERRGREGRGVYSVYAMWSVKSKEYTSEVKQWL